MTVSICHTLWIPGVLPGLNEIIEARRITRGRWNKYTDMKRAIGEEIQLLARAQKFGPITEPAYYTYLHLEKDRRRDPSNFTAGGQKLIEDGLQGGVGRTAYIPGDGWKHVLGSQHHWRVDERGSGVFLVVSDAVKEHGTMAGLLELSGHLGGES